METTCKQCAAEFTAQGSRGPTPKYCSPRCRQRARRARQADPFKLVDTAKRWTRADGKRPIQLDGSPASSTNPDTWTTYDRVVIGDDLPGDGFGVMLGDGLGCFDLDNAVTANGTVKAWANIVIGKIARPILFVEKSVSGRGLHVFVECEELPGFRHSAVSWVDNYPPAIRNSAVNGRVEFYSRARFIRFTGERVSVHV